MKDILSNSKKDETKLVAFVCKSLPTIGLLVAVVTKNRRFVSPSFSNRLAVASVFSRMKFP